MVYKWRYIIGHKHKKKGSQQKQSSRNHKLKQLYITLEVIE